MPLVAITGGIAAGKSTFTRLLTDALGAPAFDTDLCARTLLNEDRTVALEMRTEFGGEVFAASGRIDRDALRRMVFADARNRHKLEAILHPRVRATWTAWTREELQKTPDAILLVEIPLLYETAAASLFDQTIIVACASQTQLRRLTTKRQLSIDTARQMIASQWSMTEKIRLGDRLIWNDGSPASLQAQTALCTDYCRSIYPSRTAGR